jgi:hypothetical protein
LSGTQQGLSTSHLNGVQFEIVGCPKHGSVMSLTLSKSPQQTEAEKQSNNTAQERTVKQKRRKVSELVNLEIQHMKVLIEGMTTIIHLN